MAEPHVISTPEPTFPNALTLYQLLAAILEKLDTIATNTTPADDDSNTTPEDDDTNTTPAEPTDGD